MSPEGHMFLCTLDGHGEAGDKVSQFFTSRFEERLFSHAKWPSAPGEAMSDCLRTLEAECLKQGFDTEFSGTTAVLATIIGNQLTVANVGDSRIILGTDDGSGKIVPKEVSIDHKPDSPEERSRI